MAEANRAREAPRRMCSAGPFAGERCTLRSTAQEALAWYSPRGKKLPGRHRGCFVSWEKRDGTATGTRQEEEPSRGTAPPT